MMGPVQEKDTITKVSAMKNMPAKLLMPALLSAFVDQEEGNAISKAPKNDIPNSKKIAKKRRLAIQLVARLFKAAGPNITVMKKPSKVKMIMMDEE